MADDPFAFQPLARADFTLLADWFARPHVAPWWREPADLDSIEAAYGPLVDGSDPTEGFIVLEAERPIAFFQRYRLDDNPAWKTAVAVGVGDVVGVGIDYLIGDESDTGHGVGRRMIGEFVAHTWVRHPDSTAVVVAVQQANAASWRALEGAGFRRVWSGTLKSDDPSDDGPSFIYLLTRPAGR